MISPVVEKVIKELKKTTLSKDDRVALITSLVAKIPAFPFTEVMTATAQGKIIINGKTLETEQIITIRDSAIVLQENPARKIFHEQVKFIALNMGIRTSTTIDELLFSKAALWCLNEEDKLIESMGIQFKA
jgi:nitrate reductase NapAB chaperone NapD